MTLHVVGLTCEVYETRYLIKNLEPHTKVRQYAYDLRVVHYLHCPSAFTKFIFLAYEQT